VDSVLVLYHSRLVAANVTVEFEVLTPSVSVLSSAGELRQILANLVGNAVDAMKSGGRLRIRIAKEKACRQDGNERVRLTIADTGSGIPHNLLPKIFEPFISTKGETGTGLGLWVTQEIIKRNGWKITVRSRSDSDITGTTFSLQMPIVA
jgi:signal transduction histidine kinase